MCERFVGLVRVSTTKQGESRLGLESGLDDIRAYIANQGGELIDVLEEVESGTHDEITDRPTLLRALTLCKRYKATLLIPKVDRLVRSTQVHTDIKRSGVPFRACDNPSANELTLDVLVAVAAQEGREASARTKKALSVYKAEKRVSKRIKAKYDGNVPQDVQEALGGKLGAALVGCHLTDEGRDKGRAKVNATKVKDALEVYEDLIPDMIAWKAEGMTLRAIADRLNEKGEVTRTGAAWSQVQVKRTLDRGSK